MVPTTGRMSILLDLFLLFCKFLLCLHVLNIIYILYALLRFLMIYKLLLSWPECRFISSPGTKIFPKIYPCTVCPRIDWKFEWRCLNSSSQIFPTTTTLSTVGKQKSKNTSACAPCSQMPICLFWGDPAKDLAERPKVEAGQGRPAGGGLRSDRFLFTKMSTNEISGGDIQHRRLKWLNEFLSVQGPRKF